MKTILVQISVLFLLMIALPGSAQNVQDKDFFIHGDILYADSIPSKVLDEVIIEGKYTWKQRRQMRRYDKLMRKVLKVYPYARIANERITNIEKSMSLFETERERKKYVAMQEERLRKEFEKELVKLTFSEGRILIKLIDRETGNTSYELIKQLRGNLSAFFWQSIARLFGSDLKDEYDPDNEDIMIENIIVRIESGELKVASRQ
ncbi:MAG: DUF4294 domain-containing protein [Bacteroidales bacterium]|nr:DUF4294 domain-containing protein [Bacteroidales bacterium]MCF8454489.1 DUF4294 domain-containing protein [Bacteroidales bacterium]